jgi:polyhydroxyalkanoate synthase
MTEKANVTALNKKRAKAPRIEPVKSSVVPTAEISGKGKAAPVAMGRRASDRAYLGSPTAERLDRAAHASLARFTMGTSPVELMLDYLDWLLNLSISPGKQMQLVEKARRKTALYNWYALESMVNPNAPPCIEPLPQDKRFVHETWQRWPHNLLYQSFLLTQQWWCNATTEVPGVSKHGEAVVEFMTRQILDMYSPSNAPLLNPEFLQATMQEGGMNLVRGWMNYLDDMRRQLNNEKPAGAEAFKVGQNLAITSGKVIYRNRLMELIQYSPSTDKVSAEPILMQSAWMMKYYIMDLSPENSMVKYLVDQGHTVFMISWKNPDAEDRDLGMEDYRRLGTMAAVDVISDIMPGRKIHAVGYCLGGILLTIAAAAMARNGDERLASITLFTTLTDFTEVGDIWVFMGPSQVTFMEDMMWSNGYLDSNQAGSSFRLLRSNDLIWSKMVREYLLGRREPMFDLMAWNADGTRMPYRMHSELLRQLYLNNQLAQGHYLVEGRPIVLSDIRAPIFAVSADRDHVAPWRSVYKLHLQSDANELTFVLTSGGHNVGIVNEPGHPHRSYQLATSKQGDTYIDPDTWQANTPKCEGSWWPAWEQWLREHSADGEVAPPTMGAPGKGFAPLCDAPGTYVFQE